MTTPFDLQAPAEFDAVSEAFKANFDEGLEHGAAFCVMYKGQILIDLKGGWADRRKTKPLDEDALISVYSSGKAVAALIIALLADDDLLGYNQPVNTIWPEFDRFGKGELTVAQVMSHQSGLSGITNPEWTALDWFDWVKTCDELCDQEPLFTPGSASGYHPVVYGFLSGEIARRVDTYGRHLGDILRQDICEPLGLDVWLGLPNSEHERCAEIIKPRALPDLGVITPAKKAAFLETWSSPGRSGVKAWREAQLAGSNCHATAKGLAAIMQLAIDGKIGNKTFLAEDMLGFLREPRISGPDHVLPYLSLIHI